MNFHTKGACISASIETYIYTFVIYRMGIIKVKTLHNTN